MKKRCYYVLKHKDGRYLSDIDQTKNIIWGETLDTSAIYELTDPLGQKMLELTDKILKEKGIEFFIKAVYLTETEKSDKKTPLL